MPWHAIQIFVGRQYFKISILYMRVDKNKIIVCTETEARGRSNHVIANAALGDDPVDDGTRHDAVADSRLLLCTKYINTKQLSICQYHYMQNILDNIFTVMLSS